jgi:putative oxidoreductase
MDEWTRARESLAVCSRGKRATRWERRRTMARFRQLTHVLLRIVVGVLFMQHGGQKLYGWFGGMGGPPGTSLPLNSLMGVAGLLEFYGGLAIALGFLTRPVAFLLSGEMAVAYFKSHFPHGLWPLQNHGEVAVLYAFVFLFFSAHGAGGFSVDSLLFNRHRTRHVDEGPLPAARSRVA